MRSKQLEATFEAFKFPTTNLVTFRAVITPCLGECVPTRCTVSLVNGSHKVIPSFGRRRRRRRSANKQKNKPVSEEPMIVMQSIQITEKYDTNTNDLLKGNSPIITSRAFKRGWIDCLSAGGIGLIVGILLFGQIAVIAIWLHIRSHWRQWRQQSWTPRPSKDAITSVCVPVL
jgi:hypothetical protein